MITNWEMDGFSTPQQFVEYAVAYLKAAMDVCDRMAANKNEQVWANGTVANLLYAHSVELFLKGLILYRDPNSSIETLVSRRYNTRGDGIFGRHRGWGEDWVHFRLG